jgi:hypothetical protein
MRKLLVAVLLLAASQTASAQERRRSPGGEGGAGLPYIEGIATFPLSGSWAGTMERTGVGSFPIRWNLEAEDGMYKRLARLNAGQPAPQVFWKATSKTIRWEEESGAGVLVYSAQLAGPDSIAGTVTLRDGKPSDPKTAQGTFALTRIKSPARRPNG